MKDNETKEIEQFGQLQENGILIMTIVGEIEGHQLSAQNAKTTKYEHMIPLLAKAEQDQSIKGILIYDWRRCRMWTCYRRAYCIAW